MHVVIAILFAMHTLYFGGTLSLFWACPWSDAYEAIVYVAWATMFFVWHLILNLN
jgi:hypothetical protein